jgi:hypothetical protein
VSSEPSDDRSNRNAASVTSGMVAEAGQEYAEILDVPFVFGLAQKQNFHLRPLVARYQRERCDTRIRLPARPSTTRETALL